MRLRSLVAAVAALAAFAARPAPAPTAAELEALRSRRAHEERAAQSLRAREGSLLDALDAAERGATEADAAAQAAAGARAAAEKKLARAREEEGQAQAELAAREAALGPRLRARARMDRLTGARLILASDSLADLVKRRWLLARLATSDLRLFAAARAALATREARRQEVERQTAELAELARFAEARRDEAAARRDEHASLLGAVRGERALHERAAQEADAQASKLADLLAGLTQSAPPASEGPGVFERLRGHLPPPAAGPVEVGFGKVVDPHFGTVTVQKGIDIRAPAGAEVRAVAPGRVAHAGWFRGYGNLVIIDHGGGWHTLVAHLATMSTAAGEEVAAGAVLGTVGDTGSLKGPFLYFEIRERGRPVDPAAWLHP